MEKGLPKSSIEISLFLLQLNVFLRPHVQGKAHAKQMALASALVTSQKTIVAHVQTTSLEPIVTVSIIL